MSALVRSQTRPNLQESGFFARRVLQPFLDEAGGRLKLATIKDPACLTNPIGLQRGIPLVATPAQVLLAAQGLVGALMLAARPVLPTSSYAVELEGSLEGPFDDQAGEKRAGSVTGALVLWQGYLVWGNLPLRDMEALALLVARSLGPAVGSSTNKVNLLRLLVLNKVLELLLPPPSLLLGHSAGWRAWRCQARGDPADL